MASYLQAENLTKSYGDRLLFADVSFGIAQGDKVALIARNGMGKSTLLDILTGHETPDSGAVTMRSDLRIGYLRQNPDLDPELTVRENLRLAASAKHDDWTFDDRAAATLGKLGIHDLDAKVATLSGGLAKRVALGAVLLSDPELLILDEPTNHLDIEMTEWLEANLATRKCTILMVTHDRWFLDKICSKIIEIDDEQTYTYDGNYAYYLEKRDERVAARTAEAAKIKNLLSRELEWMRRQPQARGSKAQYRIDNFYQLKEKARVNRDPKSVSLTAGNTYIGSKIFEATGVSKSFGDKVILSDWNYIFARHDKVGIVGANGAGKSTFIKMLLGLVKPDNGGFDIGETVRFGYYSQEGMQFDEQMRVIDAVTRIAEHVTLADGTTVSASRFLNMFLFSPSDQRNFIYKLSGGEKRRLYLATVLMTNPNFLVLDEPTNDLDITTLTILEDYLASFKGCLIVVSHDRFFLDRVTEHLFVFEGDGKILDFPGDYSTYRHCLDNKRAEEKKAAQASAPEQSKSERPRREYANKLTFKEKREMETLTADLSVMEEERSQIEARLSGGQETAETIGEMSKRHAELTELIDTAELRLLELMEKEG